MFEFIKNKNKKIVKLLFGTFFQNRKQKFTPEMFEFINKKNRQITVGIFFQNRKEKFIQEMFEFIKKIKKIVKPLLVYFFQNRKRKFTQEMFAVVIAEQANLELFHGVQNVNHFLEVMLQLQ